MFLKPSGEYLLTFQGNFRSISYALREADVINVGDVANRCGPVDVFSSLFNGGTSEWLKLWQSRRVTSQIDQKSLLAKRHEEFDDF